MYHVGEFKCKTPNEKLQSPLRNELSPAQQSEISFESSLQSFHIGVFFLFFSFLFFFSFFRLLNSVVLIFMKFFQICQKLWYFILSVFGGTFIEWKNSTTPFQKIIHPHVQPLCLPSWYSILAGYKFVQILSIPKRGPVLCTLRYWVTNNAIFLTTLYDTIVWWWSQTHRNSDLKFLQIVESATPRS